MVRSALSKLQAKLRLKPLSDVQAILFVSIASIGGLIGLFLLARMVIDALEVLAAH